MTTSTRKPKTKAPAKRARRSKLPVMGDGGKNLDAFATAKEPTASPDTEPEPVTIKVPPPPETPEPTKAMTLRLSLSAWRQTTQEVYHANALLKM